MASVKLKCSRHSVMKKKPAKRPAAALPPTPAFPWAKMLWPALLVATLIYYWTPLFDPAASIQWDAADVHYSAQNYFAQSLRSLRLPYWTPFEYSGMPFLADPQTAGWYPLHWPFFLIGITPKAIEWELALHAFLALGGAYLLARRLTGHPGCAILAGVLYAGGGFFSSHSSHLGMFETAALAPWLLWAADRALEARHGRAVLLGGFVGGLVILAGHFQTALYAFLALLLFLIARRANWKRSLTVAVAIPAIAVLVSAIQTLPGLELTAQSIRAETNYRNATNAALSPENMVTLIRPDQYGAISGAYRGPQDITQFYFYGGLLLIPLAIASAMRRKRWEIPLVLILLPLWYALGPGKGLYSLLTLLPGFASVRAPVHIWFVVSLGLALAAAQGALWIRERTRQPWIVAVLILLSAIDLWHFNMSANPLAYSRASFEERYGNAYDRFQAAIVPIQGPAPYRIWSPFVINSMGPLNSALDSRTEVTYGYNPLELSRYSAYMSAAEANPRLLNGLAVTHKIDAQRGAILANPDALPRISAPPHVVFVPDSNSAKRMLDTLDPAQTAVVEGPARGLSPGMTRIQVVNYEGDFYRVRYSAPAECLLRIAVPYFPGWRAMVDGKELLVQPADYALSGVIVPAGAHELTFRYRSIRFALGALLSGVTMLALAGFAAIERRYEGMQRQPPKGGSTLAVQQEI